MNNLSLAFAALLVVASSCANDELSKSPLEMIAKKTWMITELNGSAGPLVESCSFDDEFRFYADNKISWNLGFYRCDNAETMFQGGIWKFSNDGKSFSWNLGDEEYIQEFDLIELSTNRFSIKAKDNDHTITFEGFDYIIME